MLKFRTETQEQKYIRMTQTPVPSLIIKMAVPTIISMLITSIYNMADTIFVGRINTSATAGVGVAFSLMALIQAIGFAIGMGSGNYISRLLGKKQYDRAEKVASTGFFLALFSGIVFMILGQIFLEPLVRLLGATETNLPYAMEYIRYILIGAPFMISTFVLNNLLRFQGNAIFSMIGVGFGGLLNIALDPLFIFTFNLGTAGAAIATIISQFVSFMILLVNCKLSGSVKIRIKSFSFEPSMYFEILKTGMPSFFRQGMASVASICLNFAAGPFGDATVAAMAIVNRVFIFAYSGLIGFGQGFQPVCGFNYGAGRYDRVYKAFWFCVKVGFVFLICLGLIGVIFAPDIIWLFRDDPEVIQIGSYALRVQSIFFPLAVWVVMCNMLMQNIGKIKSASILALSRQGLFFIPVVLILPKIIGMPGVQWGQAIADILTFAVAVPLGIFVLKEIKEKAKTIKEK